MNPRSWVTRVFLLGIGLQLVNTQNSTTTSRPSKDGSSTTKDPLDDISFDYLLNEPDPDLAVDQASGSSRNRPTPRTTSIFGGDGGGADLSRLFGAIIGDPDTRQNLFQGIGEIFRPENLRPFVEEIKPLEVLADVVEGFGLPFPRYNERERRIELKFPQSETYQRTSSPILQAFLPRVKDDYRGGPSNPPPADSDFPDLGLALEEADTR